MFLTSEAKNPQSMTYLTEFVGGLTGKSIAYIPTARNAESGWGDWLNSGSWAAINNLKAHVEAVQLEDFHTKEDHLRLQKILTSKDIIWVGGGFAGYLMYWLRVTGVDQYLAEILEKGTVYVGSSAGAMITHKSLATAEWYFMGEDWGDAETGASFIPGMDLLDFTFLPHYQEILLSQITEQYQKEPTLADKLFLVKNDEAIAIDGEKMKFLSPDPNIDQNIGRFLSRA